MGVTILLSAGFCGAVLALAAGILKNREERLPSFALWASLLFLAGLTFRLLLGYYAQGFTSDISTFKAWAYALNRDGLQNIYRQPDFFVDYPPGYLYVLLLLDKLRSALHIAFDAPSYTLLLKLPSILSDLFCAGALLWLGRKKLSDRWALCLAGAYLFCPVIWANSAQWGQVDSVTAAMLLCSMLLLYGEWYLPSALLYGLSIACKPQMLIFAPMYLFFTVKRRKWGQLALGVASALAVILLTAAPFAEGLDFRWLWEKYKSTLNYYDYYSINAYNFWTLIGWNWKGLPEGLALQLLTLAAPVAATALCGVFLFLSKRKDALFACPVLLMTVMYLFGVKMHERYLYPVFLCLLTCFLFAPDRRLLRAFGLSSLGNYFNVAHVLYLFAEKGGNYDPNALFTRCLAGVQLLTLGYTLYALAAVYLLGPVLEPRAKPRPPRPLPDFSRQGWGKWDFLALGAVLLLYAPLAFWRLGGTEMPLTPWTPGDAQSVVLEADGECDVLYYLPGIAPDNEGRAARVGIDVQVETSQDGKNWTGSGSLKDEGTGYVFSWAKHRLEAPGRFVRLTPRGGAVTLNEVGLKLSGQMEFAGLTLSEDAGNTGGNLLDEQGTVPYYINSGNSTYFDEIYHARTAYEHILGLEPYENTHPPLGKYIISLGIGLFGMNPFGWRFMGALFGVLMLPVLYHLLKQLFGKTSLCLAGTLIFAFDFMHFTQTRIATIDTYAVFFLLLMYDAMVLFLRRDVLRDSWGKLLLPLLFSGLFTGLGIAAKWTAAYGALGLAALYFGKLFFTWKQSKARGTDPAFFRRRALLLCLWCCLFFLLIPFALYFAAFLPLCTLPHNLRAYNLWDCFWNYQRNMFNYHSRLQAEHFFASPWYEWPFDIRPIWYFTSSTVDATGGYSTISALGNPLFWWAGVPALFGSLILWLRRRKGWAAVVLCGFLSVYLPWVLVPRLTFIYHYFTATPFLAAALCGVFSEFGETALGSRRLKAGPGGCLSCRLQSLILWVFTAGCLVLFCVYFPVISGLPVDHAYTDALQLFPTWYF